MRRWQLRLEAINKRIFGGCRLPRPTADMLTAAGFTLTDIVVFSEKDAPKPTGADSLGTPCLRSHLQRNLVER
ncbi:hypothetical protein [Streptomyces sp. NBC_00996]|uniref:hypothetical protein n=1 Tax=Streptomyces sp. NBC_00996 TaxID=2903710 RepID=UPI00386DAD41|nr:hypothetical protein OG390_03495 [Streptomyces sp. NBC_00996]